jgi:hypothetical protein
VGEIYSNNHYSALIILASTTLSSISMKIWSYTGDAVQSSVSSIYQIAYDVTVSEGDGSIYVIGYVSGAWVKSSSYKDCFILRLDSSLNKIYAKSIGQKSSTSQNLVCSSI